jgi:hypothetical protein
MINSLSFFSLPDTFKVKGRREKEAGGERERKSS